MTNDKCSSIPLVTGVFPPRSCKISFFRYHKTVRINMLNPKYCGVFSSDIDLTTDGQEKNTIPLASRNPECNSRWKMRPRQHQVCGEKVSFERLERMVVFASSFLNNKICRVDIANSLNTL
ncbi:hypothetical protein TNCV_3844191 [Trichonephila clavipes]|nr:hypothetical protein TNCV_3844191 [Trichonephila clavipes]